jgi:hypothetical protein
MSVNLGTAPIVLQLDATSKIDTIHNLSLYIVGANNHPQLKAALVQFWLENKAIASSAEAEARVPQVVCVVLNLQQHIVAVSTVYIAPFGQDNALYYFFRTFIRADARRLGLALRLVKYTRAHLAQLITDIKPKPQGMMIVTDNLRLKLGRINKWLSGQGFVLIGKTAEQKEVWRTLF